VAAQFDERLKAGDGGLIAVDRQGQVVVQFNSAAMARGVADSTGRLETVLGR
jgi:isoaspartyl peptidase/L-asparaginase-like protein (Ntn-hydrolase superfamily)